MYLNIHIYVYYFDRYMLAPIEEYFNQQNARILAESFEEGPN